MLGTAIRVTTWLSRDPLHSLTQLRTGKEGGFNLIAGIASATTATATIPTIDSNKIDDTRYVRAKYKLFGAGLLSGAGGVYGNEYVGLDNSLAIGAGFVSAGNGVLASNYKGETFVYGADIAGNYGNFTAGVARRPCCCSITLRREETLTISLRSFSLSTKPTVFVCDTWRVVEPATTRPFKK